MASTSGVGFLGRILDQSQLFSEDVLGARQPAQYRPATAQSENWSMRQRRRRSGARSRRAIARRNRLIRIVGGTLALMGLGLLLLVVRPVLSPSPPTDVARLFLATPRPSEPLSGIAHLLAQPLTSLLVGPTPTVRASVAAAPATRVAAATPVPAFAISSTTPSAPMVFIDPGHGGIDSGTVGVTSDGISISEKDVTLALASGTADQLRRDGFRVVLSRSSDVLPDAQPSDYTHGGTLLTPEGVLADLQRRIDRANASNANVLLSIHLNAYSDPAIGGAQTFYDSGRPFAEQNKRFATLIQSSLVSSLAAHGVTVRDRGATDDQDLQMESLGAIDRGYNHLVLLGPAISGRLRPSQMPGALTEVVFLSNPREADAVAQAGVQDAIAAGFASSIEQFLREPAP